jgi:hypothetical protein
MIDFTSTDRTAAGKRADLWRRRLARLGAAIARRFARAAIRL